MAKKRTVAKSRKVRTVAVRAAVKAVARAAAKKPAVQAAVFKQVERPNIVIEPPGPKAKEWIARDDAVMSPSLSRTSQIVGVSSKGVFVNDCDGNTYLDFGSGIAVVNVGHTHPKVVAAIKEQAEKCIHINSCDFYTLPQIVLAERLVKTVPGPEKKKVFFGNSGSEAVEAAIKLARWHTKKQCFIGFIGGFQGRTMGALSFTSTSPVARKYFAPMMPGVTHVPYAYCYRCLFKQTYPDCGLWCANYIEDVVLKKICPKEDVAGLLVEPIQGAGGYVVPPKEYLPRLAEICKDNDILFIADEVQCGYGRTGKMWACEHFGVEPDILTSSKAIASGLPMGATIARESLMDWESGSHENTLGGNPIVAAAALAVLDVIEEEKLIDNARKVGGYLLRRFKELQEKHEMIGDVRGLGMMIGVELVKDRRTKAYAHDEREKVIVQAMKKGLMLIGVGPSGLRIAPPLVLTEKQADMGIEILDDILKGL